MKPGQFPWHTTAVVLVLTVPLIPGGFAHTNVPIVPPEDLVEDDAWRYKFIDFEDFADHAGFIAPRNTEAAGWQLGFAPFHTFGNTACDFAEGTHFPGGMTLLARRTLVVPPGTSHLEMTYRADNNAWIWIDGNSVVSDRPFGNCADWDSQPYQLPLLDAEEDTHIVVAVMIRDLGEPGFFDMHIAAHLPV